MKEIKILLLSAVILILSACTAGNKANRVIKKDLSKDSTAKVYSLLQPTNKPFVFLVTPSGKKILLQKDTTAQEGNIARHDEALHEESVTARAAFTGAAFTSTLNAGADDEFTGQVRATVKTSYSTKPYKTYTSIPALYKAIKSKDFMNGLSIGHKDVRTTYEDLNVTIKKAYLYTITIEDDNDLHLLIGNTPVFDPQKTRVFIAEIPGVPKNGDAATKKHIRDLRAKALQAFNGIPVCGNAGYLQRDHKITISGSLFYDTQHIKNPAKCREVEGETAWEIHPVWDITKLN